jgi:hypothetical protein
MNYDGMGKTKVNRTIRKRGWSMKIGVGGILVGVLLLAVVLPPAGNGWVMAATSGGETVMGEEAEKASPLGEEAEKPEAPAAAEAEETSGSTGESAGGTAAPAVSPKPPASFEEEELITRPKPSAEQTRYRDKYVSGMKIAFFAFNIILLILAAALIWKKKRKG